jgi:hypothetical protein
MPKGPNGQRRKGDVVGAAIQIARIATGEEAEALPKTQRAEGGKKGGPARAKVLSAEKRKEIAAKAAKARWGK